MSADQIFAGFAALSALAFCWMTWRSGRRTKALEENLAIVEGIAVERGDRIAELEGGSSRLRAQNKGLRESNLRLLNDANQMRQRLPKLADAEPVYDLGYLSLPLEVQQAIEASMSDPAVTRPYIPDYEDREQPWTEER